MAATLGLLGGAGLLGLGLGIGSNSADKQREELGRSFDRWLPTPDAYQSQYFRDMGTYLPQATKLSQQVGQAEYDSLLAQRERALPGFGAALQGGASNIFNLMQGQLPPEVMANFQRAGGASTVGLGMGGSSFGALNTGLFGARGSLGAMQTGWGLLPTLLGALPNSQNTSVSSFLGQGVMNPSQRTSTQLAVRGQNIGLAGQMAGMDTGSGVWGQGASWAGGQLLGGGLGRLFGGYDK